MPWRRGFRRRSRGPSKVRSKEWIGMTFVDGTTGSQAASITLQSTSALSPTFGAFFISPDDFTASFDEPTLLRILISWHWQQTQAVATANDVFLEVGLIKLKLEATVNPFAAGTIANVPLPYVDSDSDWIWSKFFNFRINPNAVVTIAGDLPGTGWEDIRTRRRFENGTGLAVIARQSSNTVSTIIGQLSLSARALFANH